MDSLLFSLSPLGGEGQGEGARRILVTRTDRIGDLVLSTPVFEALRLKFPKAYLAGLTFLENREIIEGNPHLDEVILYDKRGSEKGWWGNLRFARALARKGFDLVIHLHPTNRMHLVSWLAGIPVRIGYRKKNGWALTHSMEDRKKEGLKHEAEYNFDLLKFLEMEPPAKLRTYFPLKERDRVSLEFLLRNLSPSPPPSPKGRGGNSSDSFPSSLSPLGGEGRTAASPSPLRGEGWGEGSRPYVVLNPSASCPSKIWPAERFARLSDLLQEHDSIQIVLIGSRQDRGMAAEVKKKAKRPVLDLSGKVSLGMLGWLLKEAKLLISNDSGPVHVARAVGTPVISIFGRNLSGLAPLRWGPLGEGGRVVHKEVACPVCLAHRCKINFLCLDAISVEEVFEEALRMVFPSPQPSPKGRGGNSFDSLPSSFSPEGGEGQGEGVSLK